MSRSRHELSLQAVELLRHAPRGMSCAELIAALRRADPDSSAAACGKLVSLLPKRYHVRRAGRGLYVYDPTLDAPGLRGEAAYYSAFAEFTRAIEHCHACFQVGGGWLGMPTPDIVGSRRGGDGSLMYLAGELKLDEQQLLRGFGQACAFKLFAHLSYLAVPKGLRDGELELLRSLCAMEGLGLMQFDRESCAASGFELLLRAVPGQPDPAHVSTKLAPVMRELVPPE